jgi:predicted Zn-dependent peptidase
MPPSRLLAKKADRRSFAYLRLGRGFAYDIDGSLLLIGII